MPTAVAEKQAFCPITDRPQAYDYIMAFSSPAAGPEAEIFPPRVPQYVVQSPYPWVTAIDARSFLDRLADAGISIVNQDAIHRYLSRYSDLASVLRDVADEVRRTFPEMPLALELVYDPEAAATETLVLYLRPGQIEGSLFESLHRWNYAVAERLAYSEAWFLVNLDLRD